MKTLRPSDLVGETLIPKQEALKISRLPFIKMADLVIDTLVEEGEVAFTLPKLGTIKLITTDKGSVAYGIQVHSVLRNEINKRLKARKIHK